MKEIKSSTEQKVVRLNGYSIFYYVTGNKNKELLVLLHSAFSDHRCFDQQIGFFAKEYCVVTIDMLGHGLSVAENTKDKIDVMVQHVDTILQNEGYSKAHFAGVSMGSLIAQYFGLKYPDKVLSMTVIGGYDINADNSAIAKAQRSEQLKWLFKALFSMNSFRRYVADESVATPAEKIKFYEMAKLFTRKSFYTMSGLSNVLQKRDGISLSYPLLIVTGDQDFELARNAALQWNLSEPKSQYRVIENAGHCANMDNADQFNEVLKEFIDQKVSV